MKTCYVSIPFGEKTDYQTGRTIDFDAIYINVIKPAVEEAGMSCMRSADIADSGFSQKPVLEMLLGSDIMIADITTSNPNVLYELGIRHAVQRETTIVIKDSQTIVPFEFSTQLTVAYQLSGKSITPDEATRFKQEIISLIRSRLEYPRTDSPLYEYFPDLNVELPEGLSGKIISRVNKYTKKILGYAKKIELQFESKFIEETKPEDTQTSRSVAAENPNDPILLLELLKACRNEAAWGKLIQEADAAPEAIRKHPEIQQMVALALYKRNEPGDQERAISMMQQQIAGTGGDAESYSILGHIYKSRYATMSKNEDLEEAIRYFKEGFNKKQDDYYLGSNLVNLLVRQNTPSAHQELQEILPKVQAIVNGKMKKDKVDYWDLAASLHLSCVSKNWQAARNEANSIVEKTTSTWMLKTTIDQLREILPSMQEEDKRQLKEIIRLLKTSKNPKEENSYAKYK